MTLANAPVRIATGAFILNSGLGKLKADEGTAQFLHGAAASTYPVFAGMEPKKFAKLLAVSEIAVGAALLSMVLSVFVLAGPREEAARKIEARVEDNRVRKARKLEDERTDEEVEDQDFS